MQEQDIELVDRFCERFEVTFEQSREKILVGHTDVSPLIAIRRHLEPMIFNGGWPSVFYNNIAWSVPKAAHGYALIGMQECADRCVRALTLCRRAESLHPGANFESDEWLSDRLMSSISEAEWDALECDWFDLTSNTNKNMARYLHDTLSFS